MPRPPASLSRHRALVAAQPTCLVLSTSFLQGHLPDLFEKRMEEVDKINFMGSGAKDSSTLQARGEGEHDGLICSDIADLCTGPI